MTQLTDPTERTNRCPARIPQTEPLNGNLR